MNFYSASKTPRPVRLSEQTRRFAWESLHGRYGDEAMKNFAVKLDDIEGFEHYSPLQQYDAAIARIADQAPLRICIEERISGAATLGAAICHHVPATFRDQLVTISVSHLTIDYQRVLKEGLNGYRKEICERFHDQTLTGEQIAFLQSLLGVIGAIERWHHRYLEAVRHQKPEIYALLTRVPFEPARTFHEAVQSLWFIFSFVRLCGNWPGIGRIDQLLGSYLKADLESGRLTLGEAREILASFFIKGCEWIQSDTPAGSGDAQHYQNIILAGMDREGNEVANVVTDLVLDIVEELAISDFPITVRVNEQTPAPLLVHVAQVMRHGGGVVAVYNEPLILDALEREGYAPAEARDFANDGCWEVQIPGKTYFTYCPFDALQIFNRAAGIADGVQPRTFQNIEELYQAFLTELKVAVECIYEQAVETAFHSNPGRWENTACPPSSVVSLFEGGCIEKARSYYDLGPIYTVRAPHIGGAPDVGNSLYAIQKLVFEEQKMTFEQLADALRTNWEGREEYEVLRQYVRSKYLYYGNDNDESDAYTARILDDFAALVHAFPKDTPVKFLPGVSTFGRQIEWLPARMATAFGAKKGEILSGNGSPTPGTDLSGATAIIRSYCKADLVRQTNGAALDVKLFPDTVSGENGIEALTALIRGFLALGGYFMQIDVVDIEVLRAAQKNPEAYKTLSVRVSGWNARFVTLDREWQNMIIERTAQRV